MRYVLLRLDFYGENTTGWFCQQTFVAINVVQNITMIVQQEDSCFKNTIFDDIFATLHAQRNIKQDSGEW